jgi:large subunit ribosomal protein L25
MDLFKISATRRDDSGSGAARRLRAQGLIPAVAYGKETAATSLTVEPKDIAAILGRPHGRNTVLDVDIGGGSSLTALLTDLQYHPVTRQPLHVDFVQIHLDRPVDVLVPFELTGRPKGVVAGGVLRQIYRKLPVRCLPSDIPVKLSHDVTELELNQHVLASELGLPEGVTVRLPPNQTVAGVGAEAKAPEEEEKPAAAAAAGEAAPGAAGAPAAPTDAKPTP